MNIRILAQTGNENIAKVYIGEFDGGKKVEFAESLQPPFSREEKWIIIISTLFGCCVKCRFCDAGGNYSGILSKNQIFEQIDYLVKKRYPSRFIPSKKFKIQFARMGEPAFNNDVLEVLNDFYKYYSAPGFIPSISTVAPEGCDKFFDKLYDIKRKIYNKNFQLQFSVHSTDNSMRDWLIPVKKWGFEKISAYGENFYHGSGRKITLNFALSDNIPVEPEIIKDYFSPEKFLIKLTPVNPTYNAIKNNLFSEKNFIEQTEKLIFELKNYGFEVIPSFGEAEENRIGSNCGQYLENFEKEKQNLKQSYNYEIIPE